MNGEELPADYDDLSSIEKIEFHFHAFRGGVGYRDTSPETIEYNCLAWALGITWARLDPVPRCAGYYWFPGLPRKWDEPTIRRMFENHGYVAADNYDLEEGYEKVVFYTDADGVPQHFARQLENGKWTSKVGELNDIEHDSLDSLAIPDYGNPGTALKRRREMPSLGAPPSTTA